MEIFRSFYQRFVSTVTSSRSASSPGPLRFSALKRKLVGKTEDQVQPLIFLSVVEEWSKLKISTKTQKAGRGLEDLNI